MRSLSGVLSDVVGALPLPQAILAYPQDWINGPNHTFLFQRKTCSWSGLEIQTLLEDHGIRVWGKLIVMGDIMITVRKRQARWAQYLIERAGLMIEHGTEYCASSFLSPEGLLDSELDELGF